jgi:hypothetical protein
MSDVAGEFVDGSLDICEPRAQLTSLDIDRSVPRDYASIHCVVGDIAPFASARY